MHCSHCGFEVSAEFQFCPQCGKQLSRSCSQYGYVCPAEFLFCSKCGTEISVGIAAVSEPFGTGVKLQISADLKNDRDTRGTS